MDAPKPDPIVREAEARASVEELTKGLADDAHHNGRLPPIREIEKFAQEITREQIARHEERFRNGVPDAKPVTRAPVDTGGQAKIDRGTFEDELGTVERVERAYDPARHAVRVKLVPVAEALEARLAEMRLALLLKVDTVNGQARERFPDWAERIRKAWAETLALSKNLGVDAPEARSNAADAVLALLDQSNAAFGDWRHPQGPDGRPLYFLPKDRLPHG